MSDIFPVHYQLYKRYKTELSDVPFGRKKDADKRGSPCVQSFLRLFNSDKTEIPNWVLSDHEIETMVKFLNADKKLGFIGISPSVLFDTWQDYMLPSLYSSWSIFLFGDDENIIPDFKRFCDLTKVQINGSIQEKADVIFQICLKEGYDSRVRRALLAPPESSENSCDENGDKCEEVSVSKSITKYIVTKYFFDLFAAYFYGLGCSHNPEYLLWESCASGLNESHLKLCLKYLCQTLPQTDCKANDIKVLLDGCPLIHTILKASVSLMFGHLYPSNAVPFLFTPKTSILDVSQAVFLASVISNREGTIFEMEMIYSLYNDGLDLRNLHTRIISRGPTLLIIKDEHGFVFGGYASKSWEVSPHFSGSSNCFVFRLFPNIIVCRSSGVNGNYMILSETSASGAHVLGMGGNQNRYGLLLNFLKLKGSCAETCDTWSNFSRLSHDPLFNCIDIEFWKVNGKISPNTNAIKFSKNTRKRYAIENLLGPDHESEVRHINRTEVSNSDTF